MKRTSAVIVLTVFFLDVFGFTYIAITGEMPGQKPDTLIAVSTVNIDKQVTDKRSHLEAVKAEIDKTNTYLNQLQDEYRGTLYQIDALTKLKAQADTTVRGKK